MGSEGLPRRFRLRRRSEFLRVQEHGRKVHTRHFLVIAAPSPVPGRTTRLGITITRRVGGAVVRNHLRRLVRELWRRNLTRVAPGLDVVWIAKRAAAKAGHREVARDLETVLRALVAAHA